MKTLLFISIIILAGCSTEASGNHVMGAYAYCADKGGVARLWSDIRAWHAQCVNGERRMHIGEVG